jgi:hypothetical protein
MINSKWEKIRSLLDQLNLADRCLLFPYVLWLVIRFKLRRFVDKFHPVFLILDQLEKPRQVNIITPRVGTGTISDPYRPLVVDVYEIKTWWDLNFKYDGRPFEIQATLPPGALARIKVDSRFTVMMVKSDGQ